MALQIYRRVGNWEEIVDRNFPELKTSNQLREHIQKYAKKYSTEDFRLDTGRVYTSQRFESWRERILATPLP